MHYSGSQRSNATINPEKRLRTLAFLASVTRTQEHRSTMPTSVPQQVIGWAFIAYSVPLMVAPSFTLKLATNPQIFTDSQAEHALLFFVGTGLFLVGMQILVCSMTKSSWRALGVFFASFLAVVWYASPVGPLPMFSWVGACGDSAANVFFVAICRWGYRLEEKRAGDADGKLE